MDGGAWWAAVHEVTELGTTEYLALTLIQYMKWYNISWK